MQVIVKSRHTHVPDPVKEAAQQKLEKVQRLLTKVTSLEIEFSQEHNPRISDKHSVEVTLTTKAHVLRAHASGADPLSAVEQVVGKLESQVKRLKGKQVTRRTRPGGSRAAAAMARINPLQSRNGRSAAIESLDDGDEQGAPKITKVKRFPLEPMTAEEAVLQMELLGHGFFLFNDAESAQTGVVYKRHDGSFGMIGPE